MRTYPLTYNIILHDHPVVKAEVPDGHGAADAVVVISLLRGEDQELSYAYACLDGKTKQPLTDSELFKAWVVLGVMLSDLFPVGDPRAMLPQGVLAEVRQLANLASQIPDAASN